MGYSNQTPNFGLPQWIGNDSPKREDYNDAWGRIDEAIATLIDDTDVVIRDYTASGTTIKRGDIVTFIDGYAVKLTDPSTYSGVGIAVSNEKENREITICLGNVATGITGLITGEKYYIDPTTGQLTTEINSEFIGVALSTTELMFVPLWNRLTNGVTKAELESMVEDVNGQIDGLNDEINDINNGINDLSNEIENNSLGYSSNRTYSAGQLINYGDRIFISLTNNNKGNNPLLSGANWVEYAGISRWNKNRLYTSNDYVNFGGVLYKSKTGNNQNRQPNISPSYWDSIFAQYATKTELTAEQQARINKDNDLQTQIDNIDVAPDEETIKEIVYDNSLRGLKAGDTPVYPTTTFILDETGHPVISEDGKGDYMIVMGGDERPYLRATNSMFDITTGTEYMLVVDNGQINLKEVI